MSILDKASLIQIPSGYKNEKLYSVKPNPSYGSEQISNGDFSNGSTGWTVSNGTVTDKYNASMTAYQNGIKISTFSLSGTYKLIFDLTIISGNCKFDGGGSNSQTYTTSGRKELTITNPTKFEFNAFNLGWVGTLDNVSVKEVLVADGDFTFARSSSATRVNSEGLIEEMSANVPRLDYSDGASCASLLLEPQRTNLLPYSDLSSGFTTTNVTLSNNEGTSPDGTSNATKALMASGTGTHRVYDAISSSLNDDNVLSVFIKEQNDISHIGLHADTMGNQVWFSGSDGSIINANGFDAKTESFGNGWHRISVHYVANANDAGDNQFIYFSNREFSNPTPAFDGTEEILLYGIQAEKGKYSTSLINTEGSTVTRTADVCNNAGTSATFNSTEGVLFAEIAALANDGTNRTIALNKDTNDRIQMYFNTSTNGLSIFYKAQSGTTSFIMNETLTDATSFNKIAFKWKANDFALWVNGVETDTVSSGVTPTANSLNALEFEMFNDSSSFYGKTKQLMVFDEALSDEKLSDLTGQVNLSFNNLATFYNYTIL